MIAKGKLLVIGFGPGAFEHMTGRAKEAIQESDVIIGYNTYVDLIRGLLTHQEIVRTGMTEEVSRAREAVRQAELGKKVAVISSGDAGVYGMAGLVYEVLIEQGWNEATGVGIEIIPGVSAIHSCAALLGAPIMHDACTISLSDHLTPWETIARRVEAAAEADFVIALYNPRSGRRTRQIVEAQRMVLKHRSPNTPVGLVKSAYREREDVVITTLGEMLEHDIGMLTTVLIGNSTTFLYDGKIITPRGYQRKYTLNADEQPLRPHERLRVDAEPWSLEATAPTAVPQAGDSGPAALAAEALRLLGRSVGVEAAPTMRANGSPAPRRTAILEIGVSPGVANKKIAPAQMALLAELAGEDGEMEYTTQHQIVLRVPTNDGLAVVERLKEAGLLAFPIGDVALVKACDFCNLEKDDAIPVAEALHRSIGGTAAPKEIKIGVNGCGMACYGAVMEDIGLVYRKGGYDLFLGGKQIGRNAHAGQMVAEGVPGERIVDTVERIYREFQEKGHPGERFHKFFKRVGRVAEFTHEEFVSPVTVDAVCGE
ncbi:precorrin-3B C(17)-methyltransferase [Paenibacillus sp. TRM 82003]|nr:precorrin-3B C(17)-methyltransferase [Paenibacillus sp. TRM 82003]